MYCPYTMYMMMVVSINRKICILRLWSVHDDFDGIELCTFYI